MATTREFGGAGDDVRSSTFCFTEEDHTLANCLRFVLNKDPRVSFCGYSVPHPSENRVNVRVQTTGDPARVVLKDALQDVVGLSGHVRNTFEKAVDDFKIAQGAAEMSLGTSGRSGVTHQSASSTKSQ